MGKYIDVIKNSYSGYWNYLKYELFDINHWDNYFYGLIVISILVWILEIAFPWRREQELFRKDFWLDTFYMFFNFFILNLVILIALSNTVADFFKYSLALIGLSISRLHLFDVDDLPKWFGLLVFFIVYFFSIAISHLNQANLGLDYGFLKYVFNNPKMHIWHHAKELPEHVSYGVNYGHTLSLWKYIFKTNYLPHDGRYIELGFEVDDTFPKRFANQELYLFKK